MAAEEGDGGRVLKLRKVALVAAIALAVVRIYWIVSQIRAWTQTPDPRWLGYLSVPGNALFLLPMPVLLYMLYRSGGNIAVSGNHRRLALVPAMVQGEIVVSQTYRLMRVLLIDWHNIESFSGLTVASKFADWLVPRSHGLNSGIWPRRLLKRPFSGS